MSDRWEPDWDSGWNPDRQQQDWDAPHPWDDHQWDDRPAGQGSSPQYPPVPSEGSAPGPWEGYVNPDSPRYPAVPLDVQQPGMYGPGSPAQSAGEAAQSPALPGSAGEPARAQHPSAAPRRRRRRLDPNDPNLTPEQRKRLRRTARDRAAREGRAPSPSAALRTDSTRRLEPPPAGRDDGGQSSAGYPAGPASDPGVLAVTGGMQVMNLTASSPLPPGAPAPSGRWAATAQVAASSSSGSNIQNRGPQPSATSWTPYRSPSPTPAPRGGRR